MLVKHLYASLLPFFLICCNVNTESSVIIVGAGAAGIAAATRLLENNVMEVIILEAEARIGGRVHSVEFGDAFVDMGAEWCHGQKDNIVYDMVKNFNILKSSGFERMSFDYSTKEVIDQNFTDSLSDLMFDIYSPDGNRGYVEGVSLGKYCIEQYAAGIADIFLDNSKQLNFSRDALLFFEKIVLSSEGAFSWFEPSAMSNYTECEGDDNLNWNGRGYKTILDIMMKKYPNTTTPLPIDDKILTNKEVYRIVWDKNHDDVSGVSVYCRDGTVYNADTVIFTPSLGVLKEDHKKLFVPELPEQKVLAIQTMGIGGVMKVMLHFSRVWWPLNSTGLNLVWSSEHKRNLENGLYPDLMKNGNVWILDLYSFLPMDYNPNVLSAWFAGPNVPYIEKLDDETLLKGIKFVFNTFFSHKYNTIMPDSMMRSSWCTNPHFRGTYSFETVAYRQKNLSLQLSRPLSNRKGKITLQFAGEVTHPRYYSTVHGAIMTGYREANRIINRKDEF